MYVEKILPYRTLEFNCIQNEGKHSNNKLIVISPSLLSILLVVFFLVALMTSVVLFRVRGIGTFGFAVLAIF